MASIARHTATGSVTAMSPISHGTVPGKNARKSNVMRLRRIPVILPPSAETEGRLVAEIPAISGNSIRGIGRELLFEETICALGLDKTFRDLPGLSEQQARYVAYLLAKGGFTPNGAKIKNPSAIGAYLRVRQQIPMLGLLGGNYMGHGFEGALNINYMIPVIKETIRTNLAKPEEGKTEADYPALADLETTGLDDGVFIQRFTKNADPDYGLEMPEEVEATASDNNDSNDTRVRSIYQVEVIPAGTKLHHSMDVVVRAGEEGIFLAFRALVALLVERGRVGGLVGKGMGIVSMRYVFDDGVEASVHDLSNYLDYLSTHRQEVIDAIVEIPGLFEYTIRKKDESR